jgi:hypothetical protein
MVSAVGGTIGSAQATLNSLPNTSFLIQFFSDILPDPTGFGQGQTFLGSQTVTTDPSGNATAVIEPAGGLLPSAWISATATNLSTGDTSEFAQDISAEPVSTEFAMASYSVQSTAGSAAIAVVRTGNVNATVSVNYATSNGSAIASRNYSTASGTLTFLPGQVQQSFLVTILPSRPSQAGLTTTVNLALSQPTGGATLGAISTATLVIAEAPMSPPPPPPPPGSPGSPPNAASPTITTQEVVLSGRAITGIVFRFSKSLNVNRAQDLGNYGFYVYSTGPGGVYGARTSDTPLSSAVYNSVTNSVTVTFGAPLPLRSFFSITIDGQASPLLNNGITDLAGDQLAGSSGTAGAPFVTTFAAGSSLSYTDGAQNVVKLQLKRGGLIELFRSASGGVQQLELVGTVAGKSTLTGSVTRGPGGTGRTFLPLMSGAAGVRIRLKNPPFVFRAPTLTASVELAQVRPAAMERPASPAPAAFSGHRRRR